MMVDLKRVQQILEIPMEAHFHQLKIKMCENFVLIKTKKHPMVNHNYDIKRNENNLSQSFDFFSS